MARPGNLFPNSGVTFNLFPDRLHRGMRAQKTIGQGLVFTQESEQQVFGLNIRRPELAGFVPRKEDYTPGFFRLAFKHITIPPEFAPSAPPLRQTPEPNPLLCIYIA